MERRCAYRSEFSCYAYSQCYWDREGSWTWTHRGRALLRTKLSKLALETSLQLAISTLGVGKCLDTPFIATPAHMRMALPILESDDKALFSHH